MSNGVNARWGSCGLLTMIFGIVDEKRAADAERGRKTKDRTTPSKMHRRPVNREEKKET